MDGEASFGRLIRRRRRSLDLTQEDLAKRVGYSVVTIRKVEAEDRRPSRELAERLARGLDVPEEEQHAFVALARTGRGDESNSHVSHQLGQRSGPPARTNLPVPPTRSVGRDDDVSTVRGLLLRTGARLVTLVGPPGIGKTRLSVQVSRELPFAFADGVYCVALAPLSDTALIVPTIAQTLGAKDLGVGSLVGGLIDYLREREVLLVLDNFEHLLDAAPVVAEILAACPGVRVLATSREPLHLRGERLHAVPPLALPSVSGDLPAAVAAGYSAVELFVERAQTVDPDFLLSDANARDVAAICAAVDGVPLSIELVAARVRLLAPDMLLARLNRRLSLLTDGPRDLPPRQQTLRAALDWSYDLLGEEEKVLFARLAVFAGGSTLEAAEAVVNADGAVDTAVLDGLAALVDKNLLHQEVRATTGRYFVFLETIREYAQEHLSARGEEGAVRHRFAAHYLALAEAAERHLTGGRQEVWFERLDAEHNNLRSVLEWYLQQRMVDPALKFVAALWRFWHIRSHEAEASRWIRLALALDGRCDTEARARALYGAGWIAVDQREPAEATTYFGQSLALFRSLGCRRGVAEALHGVATMAQADERFADATVLLDESLSLYRDLGDDEGIAWTLDHLGMGALSMRELVRAQELFDEGLAIFEGLRHAWGTAILRHHRGLAAMARDDHAAARRRLSEGLTAFQEVANSWGVATSLTHLGYVVLAAGDHRAAEEYFTRALTLTRADEDRGGMARSLAGLISLAIKRDQLDRAALLLGAIEAAVDTGRVHTNPVARAIYKSSADAVAKAAQVEAVAAALATGRAMPLGQVVELVSRSESTGPAVSFAPGSAQA